MRSKPGMRSDRAAGVFRRVLATLLLLTGATGPGLAANGQRILATTPDDLLPGLGLGFDQQHVFVTTPGDPPPGPTTCTLRQALSYDLSASACVVNGTPREGRREVEMAPWLVNHHLVLEQGQLELIQYDDSYASTGLFILRGHGLVIDAAGKSRVMKIRSAYSTQGVIVMLEDITVTGGVDTGRDSGLSGDAGFGGGILQYPRVNLILLRSKVHGNRANMGGGVQATGGALINSQAFGQMLFLYDSAITDNVADGEHPVQQFQATGGGLQLHNICLRAVRSTISGNHARYYGGGIYTESTATHCEFGGATNISVSSELHQSTVSGNTTAPVPPDGYETGGAAIFSLSPLKIYGSTITGNDGANLPAVVMFPNFGQATFVNTILSGNTLRGPHPDGAFASPDLWYGTASAAHSLLGTHSGLGGGPGVVETDTPDLGPLADNGGFAPTHLPSATSPALGLGREAECGTLQYPDYFPLGSFYEVADQRRVTRPGQACDAGAVQRRHGAYAISAQVTGSGRVDATPMPSGAGSSGGITNCTEAGGIACGATFVDEHDNATLRFTATPAAGWQLQGWSDDCTPTTFASQATLTIDGDRTCTATFETIPPLFEDGFE